MSNCRFCEIIEGKRDLFASNRFMTKGLKIPLEDKDFAVFPDAAPLGFGHCLITTKKHTWSLSKLENEDRKTLLETAKNIAEYFNIKLKMSLTAYFFEHGSDYDQDNIGCGITHSHFHIFFQKKGILDNISSFDIFKKFNNIEEVWNEFDSKCYYLVGEFGKTAFGCEVTESPQLRCSFFLRKLIANQLDQHILANYTRYSESDAKHDEYVDAALNTYNYLKELSKVQIIENRANFF